MPIKITSMQEGFRRCGVTHRREPVLHEDGVFTKEQIKVLQNEPMLKVEIVAQEKKGKE